MREVDLSPYLFIDPEEVNKVDTEREECGDFNLEDGSCFFYQSQCFHEINNRCYRVRPRDEGEFMEWMGDICADCNEAICNACDVYLDHYIPF